MDDLDKKVLKELQLDSRISFTKIAEKVGISTATVSDRVKRLTKEGIICGYTALIDTSKLGMVTLITKIKTKPGYNSIQEVGEAVAGMAETCCVHHVTGVFDLIVISKCTDYDECGIIIQRLKEIEGLESMDTELVLKTLKEELKVEL